LAYSKQTFADGQKLTADHMNHIESGLADLDTGKLAASELSNAIDAALAQAAASGDFDGAGISGIARTSGDGSAGTTDTYTITLTNGSTHKFTVYNGADGAGGSAGGGNRWYTGTGVTGTSAAGAVFSGSGVENAAEGDMYLNSSSYRIYQCTEGGAPESAKWAYVCYIKGATGATGAAGADSVSGASINANGYLIITLSNGDTLNAGLAKGEDGYAPQVTVSDTDGGHLIEIRHMYSGFEKVDGFYVMDGEDGATPVRGTDYWTAADIAEIKSYVDDAILGGSW